ncbi:MAG: hypothetical protein ACXABF_09360 [Candidatus Thorarchaeota archaeon]
MIYDRYETKSKQIEQIIGRQKNVIYTLNNGEPINPGSLNRYFYLDSSEIYSNINNYNSIKIINSLLRTQQGFEANEETTFVVNDATIFLEEMKIRELLDYEKDLVSLGESSFYNISTYNLQALSDPNLMETLDHIIGIHGTALFSTVSGSMLYHFDSEAEGVFSTVNGR